MGTLSKIIDSLQNIADEYDGDSVTYAQITTAVELLRASQQLAGWCYHIETHKEWIRILEDYEKKMKG